MDNETVVWDNYYEYTQMTSGLVYLTDKILLKFREA